MEPLLVISRGIDRLTAGFAVIAFYLVLFAVLISAGNATVRYLFNYSSNAFLEIQWYMFAGIVMLGTAYTFQKNGHVRVDLLYSALSDRGRLYIDIFGILVFLIPVVGYLIYLTVPFFVNSLNSGEVSMNAGGLVLWPAKLMLPLGFILLELQAISELIKRLSALQGVITVDTTYEKPLQ
ncbi:TRAP-type mannitol/chloroaromatic compound transport system permease small subunit [Rhodoligotrophos appendicifer]|uniref:TRAP transporter small permease subunit n=1 Tax=Rhodoligotrophos appendicifer TaxID=987056 RepID=UPI001180913F|nr:TRAP transporter small permease subunit [Rhodoligotrophos appendicifer]